MALWVPVAFAAVLLWVTGNIFDKFLIEKYYRDRDKDTDVDTLVMFSAAFAPITLLFAFMMGGTGAGPVISILTGIGAGLCNGLYMLCYLRAVARTELSRIIPIAQSVPFFGFIFAWVLLGEHIETGKLIAGAVILIGAIVLVFHREQRKFDSLSLFLILIASASIALQMVLFKFSAEVVGYWSGIFWSNVGFTIFGLYVFLMNAPARAHFINLFAHKNYSALAANSINEVIEVTAILVFAAATLLGPVALVETVTVYQPVILLVVTYIAARLGYHFLREDVSHTAMIQKLIGIALICAGSVYAYFF